MYKTFYIVILTTTLLFIGTSLSLANWQVDIEVSTQDPNADTGLASNKLSIGSDPAATAGYDNQFDTIALLDGPLQAYFPHPDYPANEQKLWRDLRGTSIPQEWEFEVQLSGVNNRVNITWKIDAPNMKFTLVDEGSNKEIAMKSSTGYSYTNTATTPQKFLVKAIEDTSSQGGSRGGGCGYITGGDKTSTKDEINQMLSTLLILISPFIVSLWRRRPSSS